MADKGKHTKQNVFVVVAAIATIVISVLITLVFSGALFDMGDGQEKGYRNVTFTDAVLTCQARTRDHFGDELALLTVDNHSSRFESDVYLYKIFLTADIREKAHQTIMFYITCYVRSGSGRIAKFETFEDKEAPKGKAIKKGGDKFIEWPRK